MQAIFENPRVETFSLKSSPGGFNMGQHHRPITRRRSLKDLPGGIRVPVLKKSDRLKSKLEASLAGLQELQALREKHQLLVTQAKTSLQKSQESWSSAFTDSPEPQEENGDLGHQDDGSSNVRFSSQLDQKLPNNRIRQEIALPKTTFMDTSEFKFLNASNHSTEGLPKDTSIVAKGDNSYSVVEAKTLSCPDDDNSSVNDKENKQVDMSYKECDVKIQKDLEKNEASDRSNLLRSKSFSVCQLTPAQRGETKSVVDLNRTSSGIIPRMDSPQTVPLKRKDSILAGIDITSQGPNPVHAILMAYSPSYKSQSMSSMSSFCGSLPRKRNINSPTNSSTTLGSNSDKSSSCGSVFSDRTMENEDSGKEMSYKYSGRTTRTVLKNLDSVSKGVSQSTQTVEVNLQDHSKTSTKGYIEQHSARNSCQHESTDQTPRSSNYISKERSSIGKIYQDHMGSSMTKLLTRNASQMTQSGSFNAKCQRESSARPDDKMQHRSRSTAMNNSQQLSRKVNEDIRSKQISRIESTPTPAECRNGARRESFSTDNSRLSSRNVNMQSNDPGSETKPPPSQDRKPGQRESINQTQRDKPMPSNDGKRNTNSNSSAVTSGHFPLRLAKYSQSAIALSSNDDTIAETKSIGCKTTAAPPSTGGKTIAGPPSIGCKTTATPPSTGGKTIAGPPSIGCKTIAAPPSTGGKTIAKPLSTGGKLGDTNCNEARRVLSVSPSKRTVNCDISGRTKVRRFGMPLDSKSTQNILKRQEKYQPLPAKTTNIPDYENVNVRCSQQQKSPRLRVDAADMNKSDVTPLSPSVSSQRTSDSEHGQMSLLESSRLATSTPIISKKWANSLAKLSFASDEGYCPSSASTPNNRRQPRHKLSLRSNATWISTDLDESDLSPQVNTNSSSSKESGSSFNLSHLPYSSGRWEGSLDSHRIISPSRSTRDWDTCSFRSSVSMLSLPTDVQESAI